MFEASKSDGDAATGMIRTGGGELQACTLLDHLASELHRDDR
jgi:hypothetical protein